MSLKLYGVPLSQPVRAVAWTLMQERVPFKFQLCVPGMKNQVGSQHPSFVKKSRGLSKTVPLLEVDDAFAISESSAILKFLCRKYKWEHLYGGTLERQALIDSYLSWHGSGSRQLANLTAPYFRPDLGPNLSDDEKSSILKVLDSLENGWLREGKYIAGNDLSVADMLAYEEVAQAQFTGLLPDIAKYSNLSAWCDKMSQLPFHHEVHLALSTLGSLVEENDTPMQKRLGAANKTALSGWKTAQESYTSKL